MKTFLFVLMMLALMAWPARASADLPEGPRIDPGESYADPGPPPEWGPPMAMSVTVQGNA